VITFAAAISAIILILAGIYFLQYSDIFRSFSDLPDAAGLAFYRVLMNIYATYLGHMTVYPDFEEFTGFSSIGAIGEVFGSFRNIDVEVAKHYVGARGAAFTSFPTAFVGGAYASFGYAGIVAYSLAVALYLTFIDILALKLRNGLVARVFLATMIVNATFFAMLEATPV